ncbi:response regulator [Ferrovum myxofaciens]|uniref:Response regulator n=1 Tax=Ferrovum myxofaciens TaxID=416213 RepID=A0A8F3DW10_9PROT|nr:response regulator [Ferrovum myxofaciens]KXW57441.1 response regulator receiver protein [Ferrovum myxofaciens]QKE39482.1 MAG: response regulator [Ferrovum myxofaciens]QWY74759.1 MAG: response regulator [Ferrovum myxofaciens]QWY77505.1 MAG: response regulator [Ferrovum myxofaciens]
MKILVVDDDRRIVRTTCDILKIKGHEPIPAYSGEEGVEKVRTDPPDCVLMDIKMPGLNGVEALKRMKEILPALPVVLVSAYATDDLIEEADHSGAYAVLSKPLNFPMILSFLSLLGKEESILVVDDDPEFCKTLKDILILRGFHVETETEPQRVMEHLDNNYALAIVVLDLKLGAVNGVDVMKEIKAKYHGKPVLLMTGYREEMGGSIEQARHIGAYTCLYKPFEMDDLFHTIEKIRVDKLKNLLVA